MKRPIVAIALSLGLIATMAGCHGKQAKDTNQDDSVLVSTITAKTGTVNETLVTNGTLSPADEVKIIPKTSGRIAWVVEEGARVSAGQTLATIELPEMSAQLGGQQASLEMAKTNLESARTNLVRMRALFAQGGISQQQLDAAKTQADVSARQLEGARAAVRSLNTQLANGVITAPFSGIVTARYTDAGGMASPAAPLFNLAKSGKMQVKVSIPEKDLGKIRLGLSAKVTSTAFPDKSFPAKISEIAPSVDPQTRQLAMKLDLLGGHSTLKLGMFVTAEVSCSTHSGVILPSKSIIADGPDSVIFVASGKTAKKVIVDLGARYGDQVEIRSGVKQGDAIILAGNNLVKDGDPITLKNQ